MASYVFKLRSAGRVESAMHFADISVCSSKWYFDIKVTNANAKECSVWGRCLIIRSALMNCESIAKHICNIIENAFLGIKK